VAAFTPSCRILVLVPCNVKQFAGHSVPGCLSPASDLFCFRPSFLQIKEGHGAVCFDADWIYGGGEERRMRAAPASINVLAT
jgi:hypothetical protein